MDGMDRRIYNNVISLFFNNNSLKLKLKKNK